MGREAVGPHSADLMAALARRRLKTWSYPGAIGIVERDEVSEREDIHVVHNWCYLGTVHDEAQLAAILETRRAPEFDRDTYKLLVRHLGGKVRVMPLASAEKHTPGEPGVCETDQAIQFFLRSTGSPASFHSGNPPRNQ